MEQENKKNGFFSGWTIWSFFKAFFIFIIIANVIPMFLGNFSEGLQDFGKKKIPVSLIEIGDCNGGGVAMAGLISSADPYSRQIRKAADNDQVKAIVLKINSGGGVPAPCELISRDVAMAREKKPVIAVVEHMCGSGAYWIASPCNKIICPETAIVGSIGALMASFNVRALAERFGVKPSIAKSGKYKAMGHPFEESVEPWQHEYKQAMAKEVYKIFATDVAKKRNLSLDDLGIWGEGRIFTGKKGLEIGLVDQIGGFPEAEELLKELTGKEGKIHYVKTQKPSPLAAFLGRGEQVGMFAGIIQCASQLACAMTTAVCQTLSNYVG